MIKKYNVFIKENMDMDKSIINKKVSEFKKLKTLLSKNIGYIGKFTEYLMNENIPYEELENLYTNLLKLSKRQQKLDI